MQAILGQPVFFFSDRIFLSFFFQYEHVLYACHFFLYFLLFLHFPDTYSMIQNNSMVTFEDCVKELNTVLNHTKCMKKHE